MRYTTSAFLKKIYTGVIKIEEIVCIICLTVFTTLILLEVVNRYLLHFEVVGLSDLAVYFFVFFMFIAGAVTTRRKGNVSVDVFRDWVTKGKPTLAALYRVLLDLLGIITVLIFLYVSYHFMVQSIKFPEWGTLVPWFNTSWLQSSLFFAFLVTLVHQLVTAFRDTRDLK